MIQSIPQLEALREDWDALAAGMRSPLLEHDWFLSCAEAFHRGDDLRILTARQGQALIGAAPLVRESSAAGPRLRLLGVSRLYEPSGWLFDSSGALSQLVDQSLALGQPMVLQRIPAESPITQALTRTPRHQALTVVRPTAPALAVPTHGDWDRYYASVSSQIRTNLRRTRRKAEAALGPMVIERVSPLLSQVDAMLESVMAVEGSGWKGRRGSSLAARADLRDFFRRYCHRAAEKGRLRIARLWFGSRLAAVELAVEAYSRMWQLKIGYDEQMASFYPGLQLTESSIRSAFEHGLDAYEFLGSAASWEERWRPDVRRFHVLAVYPLTAPGIVGACRDAFHSMWRRASRGQVAS